MSLILLLNGMFVLIFHIQNWLLEGTISFLIRNSWVVLQQDNEINLWCDSKWHLYIYCGESKWHLYIYSRERGTPMCFVKKTQSKSIILITKSTQLFYKNSTELSSCFKSIKIYSIWQYMCRFHRNQLFALKNDFCAVSFPVWNLSYLHDLKAKSNV